MPSMIDPFGRRISYLRVSVTDRCDFRCVYCMAEDMTFLPKAEILTLEELDRLCSAFVRLGVRKLRLTGGEPLVRKNIMSLVRGLSRHLASGALDELTLTTNGSQLARHAAELAACGVRRVNVSLDTLDPAKFAGLSEGDAHVIRNAGGRASDDAIRSLVISYKLLGTQEFFVIHHTDCGMEFFTNDVMRDLLNSSLETAELTSSGFRDVGKGPGSRAGEYIEWLAIKNQKQSVLDDVARIRNHPLVPNSIPVHGYLYDVRSGKLLEVEAAKSVTA